MIMGSFLKKEPSHLRGKILMQGYMIEGLRLYQSTMSQLTFPSLDCGAKIQPLFGSEKFNKNCIND